MKSIPGKSDPDLSKSEYSYQTIRDNIINGTYIPGTVLYIRELSEKLNVSRTPIKDAINRLAYEGYVELFPERYAIVSKIDYSDIVELLELREYLESASAFYAAQRHTESDLDILRKIIAEHKCIPFDQTKQLADLDMRLHMAIAHASYNRQLIRTLQTIFERFLRVTLPIQKVESRYRNSLIQHDSVLTAIAEGNAEAAKRLMGEHVRDILTSVRLYQYQNIHLFK